ncbi:MAG: PAS domain S-box protein, partial [Candidatus Hydrothermarchaeaceae archaeon]
MPDKMALKLRRGPGEKGAPIERKILKYEARILVIDDDPQTRETIADIFQGKGYGVDMVDSGESALKKAKKTDYDIALIDIKLPDMNGIDLLRKLKKGDPGMACIVITGNATMQNAIDALGDGASGYFVKPLVIDEVIHRVDEVLDKQELQQELNESLQRYQGLVETSTDAIISMDDTGEIVQWNDAASRIFGHLSDEVLGRQVDILIPQDYLKRHEEGLQRFLKTGVPRLIGRSVEVEGLRKDGTTVPIEISISVARDNSSHIFTAIIRDITERKRAKDELVSSKEFSETVLNSMNDAVSIIDVSDFKIVGTNRIFLESLGLKEK